MVSVQLLGAKELVAQFAKLGARAPGYIDKALEAGAEYVTSREIRSAPINYSGRGREPGVLVSSMALSNFSFSATHIEKHLTIGASGFYWRFLEFGTKHMKPHPFVRRIFSGNKGQARAIIRDTFRDLLLGFE